MFFLNIFIWNCNFFSFYNCVFLMMNNNQRQHTYRTLLLIYFITLPLLSACPWARHWTLKLPWLRASAKCLKCKITVLSSLMSLGYSGLWRRSWLRLFGAVTSVLLERIERKENTKKEESESRASESSTAKYYVTTEQGEMGGETYGPSQR